jgi:tripartite-type tricarboxylate transporter receptor subunit TctC
VGLSAAQSQAKHWPQRPVKFIVPIGPGLDPTAQVINPGGPCEFAASIDAQPARIARALGTKPKL